MLSAYNGSITLTALIRCSVVPSEDARKAYTPTSLAGYGLTEPF